MLCGLRSGCYVVRRCGPVIFSAFSSCAPLLLCCAPLLLCCAPVIFSAFFYEQRLLSAFSYSRMCIKKDML